MADDPNMPAWAPGQPAPWLDAYGAPPTLSIETQEPPIIAGGPLPPLVPPAPPAPPPPPPPQKFDRGAPAPDEAPMPHGVPPDASVVGDQPPAQTAGFAPPWLQAMTQPYQPGPQRAQPDAVSGAAPAVPSADAISGGAPQPASENPDASFARIATDPNAPLADRQRAFAAMSPELRARVVNNADPTQLAAIATSTMAPEDLATIAVRHQQAQIHEQNAAQLELAQRTEAEARRNWEAQQAAYQRADVATQQLAAEAQQLSQQKIDPNEHGVGHFISSVITSAIGGAMSQYTGGRNLALEELDKATQRRIDAQKADLANQWQGVSFKRNLIGEQLQRSGDLYHAQELYRVSQYDRATAELQTKMQDYDPQGTTALRSAGVVQQIQQARAQALMAYNQQQQKNFLETIKGVSEAGDKLAEARAKKGGGLANPGLERLLGFSPVSQGGGTGLAGSAYTVATGIFDPLSKQEVMARVPLSKEDKVKLKGEIDDYADEQAAWAKLEAIARRVQGHKGTAGTIVDRFKTTDERDYKSARNALLVHKTKALGERPNESSIKQLEDMVPDLQVALSAADTGELLARAAADSDGRFARHLNVAGVNGDATIANMQRSRAPAPEPSHENLRADAIAAMGANLPGSKAFKDAQATLEELQQDDEAKIADRRETTKQAVNVSTLQPVPIAPEPEQASPSKVAAIRTANHAAAAANVALRAYQSAPSDQTREAYEGQLRAYQHLLSGIPLDKGETRLDAVLKEAAAKEQADERSVAEPTFGDFQSTIANQGQEILRQQSVAAPKKPAAKPARKR